MFPDAVMIAEDTRGPMNADVLPTTEKSAKNRHSGGMAWASTSAEAARLR